MTLVWDQGCFWILDFWRDLWRGKKIQGIVIHLLSCVLFKYLPKSTPNGLNWLLQGSISEAELDSFNLPLYFPSLKEMTQLVQSNGCFSIESMELTDPLSKMDGPLNIRAVVMHFRAGLEGIFTKHFGSEIIDELFERTLDKSTDFSSRFESSCSKDTQLFLVLKHKWFEFNWSGLILLIRVICLKCCTF